MIPLDVRINSVAIHVRMGVTKKVASPENYIMRIFSSQVKLEEISEAQ